MKETPNNYLNMILAEKLKALLKEHDITIAQLSRATEVPRQTLDNWLIGQEPRSLKQVKLIATFFEVSLDELCFDEKPARKPIKDFSDEIFAGEFEVVLRRIKR